MERMTIEEYHRLHGEKSRKLGRASQGRLAQASGDAWEEELAAYHRQLEAQKLAVVDKTGPAVKWVGPSQVVVVAPGPCDYVATLAGGQAVHFEAKSTAHVQGFTLPLKSLHQLDRLRRAAALGAVAFYLVRWQAHNEARVHPVDTVDGRRIRHEDGHRLRSCWWLEWVTV